MYDDDGSLKPPWRGRDTGITERRDVYNFGKAVACWKCSHPRPTAGSRGAIRWLCPNCSSDEYTISAVYDRCPDCGRDYDRRKDAWWKIADQPDREAILASSSSGAGGGVPGGKVRRKRGGRKHKKAPQQDDPSQVADDDMEVTSEAEEESWWHQPQKRLRSKP